MPTLIPSSIGYGVVQRSPGPTSKQQNFGLLAGIFSNQTTNLSIRAADLSPHMQNQDVKSINRLNKKTSTELARPSGVLTGPVRPIFELA